jgi:SAM-dependent methyltransferase
MTERAEEVARHYQRPGLLDSIDAALRSAGRDPERPRLEDLAGVDHFHLRGLEATHELARLAGVAAGMKVLDLGGGIGGPARVLASVWGADVTVLDLTPEFCRTGEALTRRLGLDDRVRFRVGDALRQPFEAGAFDLVWTQHSTMNIPDKPRLYHEAHRVLRRGGALAMHEVAAGPGGPAHFPVPWAPSGEISFLLPAAELRSTITAAGFREAEWEDVTAVSTEWLRARFGAPPPAGAAPALTPQVILGEGFRPAFENLLRNLDEHRVRVVEAVFQRAE